MHFLLLMTDPAGVRPSLERHEHTCHLPVELKNGEEPVSENIADPALLLPLLSKKQWNLVTTHAEFVRELYEKKSEFAGSIVLLLSDAANPIDRLFDRYKRLSPRRLYTVTGSRVKIRQLPGGHV
jgi:hypothetical protein